MREEITIRGDRGELKVQLLGRENSQARNSSDADWLRGRLVIKADGFGGEIKLALWAPELMTLRSQLEMALTNLKDDIHFVSMEANWTFNVTFRATGTAVITGEVIPDPMRTNALHYEFLSDPISLELTLQDLRRATEAYSQTA